MDSMDDFIDNIMDRKTANKVNKLNHDYENIIYKLREAHDIKKELEDNLQLGKEKRRKTINPMSPTLTNINTRIENLEKEKERIVYQYTQTMNDYDIRFGRTLVHAYGGTKKENIKIQLNRKIQ